MERIHEIYRPTNERKSDWHEVERMLTDDELKEQTSRCQSCGIPFCHGAGCPLGNLVPDQNRAVARGDFRLAYELLSANSDFPEFTSRICPALCEASCVRGLDEEAVMVRQSEKVIIETAFAKGWVVPRPPAQENGKKAAVIGAGPSGLSAAVTLRRRGWAFGTGSAIFFVLKRLGILRVSPKTELKGLDLTEHGQDAYASFQFFSNT